MKRIRWTAEELEGALGAVNLLLAGEGSPSDEHPEGDGDWPSGVSLEAMESAAGKLREMLVRARGGSC